LKDNEEMLGDMQNGGHPVARKWQWYAIFIYLSFVISFIRIPFAGAFAFTKYGGGYAYFGFFVLIIGHFTYLFTFGLFLGKTGWRLVAGLTIPIPGAINEIIMLVLILKARNDDWIDMFDWPMYGAMPSQLLTLFFIVGLLLPVLYFCAIIISHFKWMDPKQIAIENENANQRMARVVNPGEARMRYEIQITDRNLYNQQAYNYNQNGASHPQEYPNQPQVLIIDPSRFNNPNFLQTTIGQPVHPAEIVTVPQGANPVKSLPDAQI
jgi:hypothetical protein